MARVLVTGGAGSLGAECVTRLKQSGNLVRVMSRRSRPADTPADIEWAQADLLTGQGVAHSVAGVDAIIHCASNPIKDALKVERDGTQAVLDAARATGVRHFIYISIVGIDRFPTYPYYQAKLAGEAVVQQNAVPWSIQRAVQFYSLVDRFASLMARFPIMLIPLDWQLQAIDEGEVADRLVEIVGKGPSGRLPDMGGPAVRRSGEMIPAWLKARNMRRIVLPLPLFGQVANGFRQGYNTCPDHHDGKITWEQWLERRYGATGYASLQSRLSR